MSKGGEGRRKSVSDVLSSSTRPTIEDIQVYGRLKLNREAGSIEIWQRYAESSFHAHESFFHELCRLVDEQNGAPSEEEMAAADADAEQKRLSATKEAHDRAEKEARERAEKEAHDRAEKEARERADKEARDRAEKEARERAEKEARDRAEKEARERAEKEARDRAEKEARERAEKEARDRAEKEARDRAETETRDRAEKEAASDAKAKKELLRRLQCETDRREKEEEEEEAARIAAEKEAAATKEREEVERLERLANEQRLKTLEKERQERLVIEKTEWEAKVKAERAAAKEAKKQAEKERAKEESFFLEEAVAAALAEKDKVEKAEKEKLSSETAALAEMDAMANANIDTTGSSLVSASNTEVVTESESDGNVDEQGERTVSIFDQVRASMEGDEHEVCKGKCRIEEEGCEYEGDYVVARYTRTRSDMPQQYLLLCKLNLPHGHGCKTNYDNDGKILRTIEGEWNLGKMHGNVVMNCPDNYKIAGKMVDGKIARGVVQDFSSGTSLSGSYIDGIMQGQGQVKRDGLTFVGAFDKGRWEGQGVLTLSNHRVRFECIWREGQPPADNKNIKAFLADGSPCPVYVVERNPRSFCLKWVDSHSHILSETIGVNTWKVDLN